MRTRRILILEDSRLDLLQINRCCEINEYEVVGTADSVKRALRMAAEHKPDVVLVDIELRDGESGIDFVKSLPSESQPAIIFITSHMDERVIREASEVESQGYLLKPFDAPSLKAVVEFGHHKHDMKKNRVTAVENPVREKEPECFFVKVGNMYRKIRFEEINVICSSNDKYTNLELQSGNSLPVRKSLVKMEEMLPAYFWRVHRTCIVNSRKIEGMNTSHSEVFVSGKSVPVGRSYRLMLSERFDQIN